MTTNRQRFDTFAQDGKPRSPYSMTGPQPRSRTIAWQEVVKAIVWTLGGSALVVALMKLGGGW